MALHLIMSASYNALLAIVLYVLDKKYLYMYRNSYLCLKKYKKEFSYSSLSIFKKEIRLEIEPYYISSITLRKSSIIVLLFSFVGYKGSPIFKVIFENNL